MDGNSRGRTVMFLQVGEARQMWLACIAARTKSISGLNLVRSPLKQSLVGSMSFLGKFIVQPLSFSTMLAHIEPKRPWPCTVSGLEEVCLSFSYLRTAHSLTLLKDYGKNSKVDGYNLVITKTKKHYSMLFGWSVTQLESSWSWIITFSIDIYALILRV